MSSNDRRQKELIEWLTSQGHSESEIDQILAKVAEYDSKTMHESLFDSIDCGKFDIQSLIDEALGEDS